MGLGVMNTEDNLRVAQAVRIPVLVGQGDC
jgi:hypothetical protein